MKRFLLLVFTLATFFSFGQKSVEFHPISELDKDTSAYKVILVSAPWCGICKANHEMIEKSDAIFDVVSSSVMFFEMENDFTEAIEFDNKTFHFVQRGPTVGEHQFVEYLIESSEVVYPTFVLFNGILASIIVTLPIGYLKASHEVKIGTYRGFVNESDWFEIFGTILNHLASPDSVTSN